MYMNKSFRGLVAMIFGNLDQLLSASLNSLWIDIHKDKDIYRFSLY